MANSNMYNESSVTNDAKHLPDASSNAFLNDVAFLQEIVSSPEPTEEELSESDISAVLKQMEAANGVAQGVESKLDQLLGNLEGLLEGLEGVRETRPENETSENASSPPGTTDPRHT